MITTPTVFVLGAGASCSYGYPCGESLKSKCAARVQNMTLRGNILNGQTTDFQFTRLSALGFGTAKDFDPSRCHKFAQHLSLAAQPSIDAFLDAYRDEPGFEAIGKAAIAQVLLYDRSSNNNNDDWLEYLLKRMIGGARTPEAFINNKVSFITFNYDSYLEHRLTERIQNSYRIETDTALNLLSNFPIHHVYGKIDAWKNGPEPNQSAWIEASKQIRTIYDAERDLHSLDMAKELLKHARKICLLGFGFHQENIDLLDLENHLRNCVKDDQGLVASSRYGITHQEWLNLTQRFQGVTIHDSSFNNDESKCLDTLRNTPIFS